MTFIFGNCRSSLEIIATITRVATSGVQWVQLSLDFGENINCTHRFKDFTGQIWSVLWDHRYLHPWIRIPSGGPDNGYWCNQDHLDNMYKKAQYFQNFDITL